MRCWHGICAACIDLRWGSIKKCPSREKIKIPEYCQDRPNFHGNRLMVELKMTILAAVGPMRFECTNESARIHYVGTQSSRVRKAPTGRRQLGPPQTPHAATREDVGGPWRCESQAMTPGWGSGDIACPEDCVRLVARRRDPPVSSQLVRSARVLLRGWAIDAFAFERFAGDLAENMPENRRPQVKGESAVH